MSVTLEFYDEDGQLLERSGVANTSAPTRIAVPYDAARMEMSWPGVPSPATYDVRDATFAEITLMPPDPPQVMPLGGAEIIARLPVDLRGEGEQ